jgi:MFS transporter, DHA1 family, tetracycline resistance protein
LLGSFIGYSLAAFALMINSLTLLIIGRIIAGFTSGSQPIAQAAIVGISAKNHLARNIGLIILSVSLGFALGPFIGGVLSDPTIFAAFNFSTPLIFAAIISILNAVFLFFAFKETYKASGKWQVRLGHAVSIFISAFKNERIRHLSLVFFIMMVGWSGYFTFISAFMLQRYQITPFEVSMYLGVMGCGFAVGCGVLVGYFTKRFALKKIVVVASLLTALSVFLTVAIESTWVPWVLTFCIGMTNATAYSVILAIFSSQVSATEQGWVMGVTGSIMALCFGVTSILTGFLSSYGIGIPMIISAIGLALSAVVMAMLNVSDQSSQLEVPAS